MHRFSSKFTSAIIAVLLLASPYTLAQTAIAPVPVTYGGYASDEKTLYIRGGSTTVNPVNPTGQFYALDMTKSWNTTDPAWQTITSDSKATYYNSLALSSPNQLIEWSLDPGMTIFNLSPPSGTSSPYPSGLNRQFGMQIAVDPTTGMAGVPCAASNGTAMVTFKAGEWTITTVAMPTTGLAQRISHYSFVWSSVRSTENGTKMIVFGGQRATDWKPLSAIYVLDMNTLQWTAGTPAPAQEARTNMACAVSGDYFIAWGGSNGAIMGPKPIVYNMKTKQWVDQFTAQSSPSKTVDNGSNIGAIAGGVGGAAALIFIIIGFVFYRRRQHKQNAEKNSTGSNNKEKDDKDTEKDGSKPNTKPGNDLKNPQDFGDDSNPLSTNAAGNIGALDANDKDGYAMEKATNGNGYVIPRNPQSYNQSTELRNPQYRVEGHAPAGFYQNKPQYIEPGTQFPDIQYYPTLGNPQLYASSSPYSTGYGGNIIQSQDFSYPPVPPLAVMGRDSQVVAMSDMMGRDVGANDLPMNEEILKLQIALVKAKQDQQFQLQQQNLARFRAEQEAQLQMLQQQLRIGTSSSAFSTPVPASAVVDPGLVPGTNLSQSSLLAPIPKVDLEPSQSTLDSTATTALNDSNHKKSEIPNADYVTAPPMLEGSSPITASMAISSPTMSAVTTSSHSVSVPAVSQEDMKAEYLSASVPVVSHEDTKAE
ncbi:hypothetical protein FBU30_010498 [Linnemannia zychae]|nr:hypothetical protein FBU30_010498 [Linnemannia zychae]